MTSPNTLQEYTEPAKYTIGESETCLTALLDQIKTRPYGVLFSKPANYEWVNVTAKEFQDEVFAVAKGIISVGVEQGGRVALLSNTRYEWAVLDFAIWAAGAVSVPIYSSSSLSQIEWIIEDSGAVLAITETPDHTDLMKNLVIGEDGTPAIKGSPSKLRRILEINSSALETLKFEGRELSDELVWERIHATKAADLASLVYTSGTTGRPKGCELSHYHWLAEVRALITNDIGAIAMPGSRLLTFLPLAHVLARAVHLAFAVTGATQSHWSDFSTLTLELQRSRPNLILGVPRVFEKVRNAAAANAADGGAIKRIMFERAEKAAIEYSMALDTAEGPSSSQVMAHKVFDKLVYSKIRAAVGGDVQYAITGGSAMGQELLHFFRGVGMTIYEGYGLTESAAAAAVDFTDQKIGTVGKPMGGMTIKINEDGEIMLKGEMLFQGYWNNPEATAEALHDGWFNTGDLGELLESGHLVITGRKKDLIVTAGGKNVSPGPMEDIIRAHPLVSQAMVVGDGKPFVGLLVTLDPDMLKRWKLNHNIAESRTVSEIATDPALRAEIQDAVNNANATVSHSEAIKRFYILDRDLTEEADELTPTLKVKRNVVVRRYADAIDHIYNR
ncbi:long-chain fatty acid--CoA ligase [Corynebacterium glutamicum]|uniref:AMP-dependent synthetase/ligase n=1 Tax=Corynebacterium glutamicum TaxID=1718 RepID=UPI00071FB8AE|nr:long-chain fatty acid--CoA ligase [Corynebacterium glutamicum]ALP50720.1 long-chain fatty acid--CoA ligase [Corynebacterium glutamicum]ANU34242.1 long-chain fatty acid--CoA ligase [Corynebacterium glutamicum]APT07986.1 long-chain fatty acid--CoA ligase [Corynebacterium glutamicum]QWQ84888.1 long-chain fatty acid--CoA ligase [Corynebacterium glutamicum]WFP72476.1 long-chain fatty acid--CoA ligase [Corynebacterium glutamicum]